MSDLLDSLRERLGESVTDRCSVGKCAVDFDTFPKHFSVAEKIAINIDVAVKKKMVSFEGKKCDFLIIVEQADLILVLPVEIKTGNVTPSYVSEQIGGGLKIFEQLVQDRRKKVIFIPCCLSKAIDQRDLRKLKKQKIPFQGERQGIQYVRCGKRFWEIIEKESLNRGA